MKTPNMIINDIQAAIAEETIKGVFSDSVLRVVEIIRQAQAEAYEAGQRNMRESAANYVAECLAALGVLLRVDSIRELPIQPLPESTNND